MRLEALPARYGDCLLITFGEAAQAKRLLIDGGPSRVFPDSLAPRLEREREALGLLRDEPLRLDAVMVSHIDEDHIYGILELFQSMNQADDDQRPRAYDVTWLLHNSLDSLLGEGEGGVARRFGRETVLAGFSDAASLAQLHGGKFGHTAELVLQSYPQGTALASSAARLQIGRNPPDGLVLSFEQDTPRVLRLGDASLTIIGPLTEEVDALRDAWRSFKNKTSPKADLAAYLDKSVPNLSSIVALLESDGARVLLTGDARGDNILKGLEQADLLDEHGKISLDVLKLPHHGSERNVDVNFFERITAEHYVVSGDGTFGNPDRGMFEMLDAARPGGEYSIHMTFDAGECDATHKEWRATRKTKYVAAEHSLVGLFQAWKKNKKKIKFNAGPVDIVLGA